MVLMLSWSPIGNHLHLLRNKVPLDVVHVALMLTTVNKSRVTLACRQLRMEPARDTNQSFLVFSADFGVALSALAQLRLDHALHESSVSPGVEWAARGWHGRVEAVLGDAGVVLGGGSGGAVGFWECDGCAVNIAVAGVGQSSGSDGRGQGGEEAE